MNRRPTDPPFLKTVQLRRELVPSFDVYPFSIPAIKQTLSKAGDRSCCQQLR